MKGLQWILILLISSCVLWSCSTTPPVSATLDPVPSDAIDTHHVDVTQTVNAMTDELLPLISQIMALALYPDAYINLDVRVLEPSEAMKRVIIDLECGSMGVIREKVDAAMQQQKEYF